jgi:hypothetical protein
MESVIEIIMKTASPVLVLTLAPHCVCYSAGVFVGTGFVYAHSQTVFARACHRSFALS